MRFLRCKFEWGTAPDRYRKKKGPLQDEETSAAEYKKMRLIGIEPTHAAPEATALSTELQTHLHYITTHFPKLQALI